MKMTENSEITKRGKLKELYARLCDIPFPAVPIPDFTSEFADIDGVIAGFACTYSEGAEDEVSASLPASDEEIIANCEKSVEKALASYKPSSEKDKKALEEFLARKSLHSEVIKNVKEIIKLKKRNHANNGILSKGDSKSDKSFVIGSMDELKN